MSAPAPIPNLQIEPQRLWDS
ncbi:MAG: hypothetical protein QOG66_765, partial [Methylobacteriaceae bacterium]|nr:hypothetical protein [Methylobacteriaceae bacterium]